MDATTRAFNIHGPWLHSEAQTFQKSVSCG